MNPTNQFEEFDEIIHNIYHERRPFDDITHLTELGQESSLGSYIVHFRRNLTDGGVIDKIVVLNRLDFEERSLPIQKILETIDSL